MWRTFYNAKLCRSVIGATRFSSTSVRRQQVKVETRNYFEPVEGLEIEGFKVLQVENIPDFQCRFIKLQHCVTGAEYVHIDRNDSNNVFAIAFRTTPFNSTGLPHILEHITLCGSQKYPVRDPFFKMLNRSLATFMNAMTGPDYTVYPFATQNHADYYNLMSVYLDAVFKPLLRLCDFRQEGWRLEHEDVYNPDSPIILKGVVFNEMKGVFSENQNIFTESLLNNILPSHTYGYISGGDPLVIPELTHNDLVEFHKNHYHPSNAKVYSYGNFYLPDHLKCVDSYLGEYTGVPDLVKKTQVPSERRWSTPKMKHIFGRYDPLAPDKDKQSILAVSYLCEDILNVKEVFVLKVLSKLLTEGPNSPFYRSLLEANIGSGYAPSTGFESQTRDTIFTVGLQGMSSSDFDKVEEGVCTTLRDVIENGFDEKNVENVLHCIELSIKHQEANFGLDLLFSLNSLWNHGGDLTKALKVSEYIEDMRSCLKSNPRYFQEKVDEYFRQNMHRLTLTMSPSRKYEEKLATKESELLKKKLSSLKEAEKDSIFENGLNLRKEQEKVENIDCLPTLKIHDIKPETPSDTLDNVCYTNVPVQVCQVPTNGISYFHAVLNTSDLSEESKSLLPLFTEIVCRMGTSQHDYRTMDQLIYMKTGGLNVNTHVSEDSTNSDFFEEGICLSSHCLDRNAEGMFNLWTEILSEVSLKDVERFSTLVRVISGDFLTNIAHSGHHYAMLSASSVVNPSEYRREIFGGMCFVLKLREIAQMTDLSPILDQIRQIANQVLCKKYLRCSLNVSPESEKAVLPLLSKMVENIPGCFENPILKNTLDIKQIITSEKAKKHFVLPFSVNYTAKSVPSVSYTDADYAPLKVLCRLLTNKYLLPLVREKYGAYGTGATLSSSGVIQFYSYRDPNSVETLEIFDKAGEWVLENKFKDEDINEAKLGVFQKVDMPIPPSSKGMRNFLYGITDQIYKNYRHNLMNVNRESLLHVSEKYLTHEMLEKNSAAVVIGPENELTENWLKIS